MYVKSICKIGGGCGNGGGEATQQPRRGYNGNAIMDGRGEGKRKKNQVKESFVRSFDRHHFFINHRSGEVKSTLKGEDGGRSTSRYRREWFS